jgi:hypothetical protein
MNRMLRHRGAKAVANFLIVALLAPILGSLGAGTALAQYSRVTRQLGTVVYDIQDVSKEVSFPGLSALARDEVWNQMHLNRWFLPVPTNDVKAEIERSKLQLPLDAREQSTLARELQADVVASGFVRVTELGGEPRVATVQLQIFLLDAVSEEYVNGATVTQSSDPMPGWQGPDSTLISEAVKKAASAAVDEMGRYQVPEGYVITEASTGAIRITRGEREDMEPGDKFVVIGRTADRNTDATVPEVRGIIEVTDVRATYSLCRRVEGRRGQAIQIGDMVRGLYWEKPIGTGVDVKKPGSERNKLKRDGPKIIGILVLLIAFGYLLKNNGARSTPNIAVRASGVNIPGLPNAIIRVRWSPPQGIPLDPEPVAGYVIGYELYRGSVPEFPLVPSAMIAFLEGGRQTRYDDDSTAGGGFLLATITEIDVGGGSLFQVTFDVSVGPPYAHPGEDYNYNTPGPAPGLQYYYAVRVVSSAKNANTQLGGGGDTGGNGGGTQTTDQGVMWSVPYRCGPVTALQPAVLQFPPDRPDPGSTDVDLNTALFQWTAVGGADTYVIELSTNRDFPTSQTIRSREILIPRGQGSQSISEQFHGSGGITPGDLFRNWKGPIYWRVGAKSTRDQFSPIDGAGRDVQYVVSVERSFEALELPPSP